MVDKLPSVNLVRSWIDSNLDINYQREAAYEQYLKNNIELRDTELDKLIDYNINWQELLYRPNLNLFKFNIIKDKVWFGTLDQAFKLYPEINLFIESNNKFSALQWLSLAAYNSCLVLYISQNTVINETVFIDRYLHFNYITIELLIIYVDKNCKVTLEDIQNSILKNVTIRSYYLILKENAEATLIKNKSFSGNSYIFSETSCFLEEKAMLNIIDVTTSDNTINNSQGFTNISYINYYLLGLNSEVEYLNLNCLKSDEKFALITNQYHKNANTKSKINIKAVLQEKSRSFYKGTIVINNNAKFSQADQQHKALILSSQAQNCSIPSLEVKTNEVQCQHGSAAGRVSEEQLWYLRSRGLDRSDSQKIIIDGFFANCSLIKYNSLTIENILKRLKIQLL